MGGREQVLRQSGKERLLGGEGGGGGRQRERVWEAESKHLGNQGRRGFFGGEGAGK